MGLGKRYMKSEDIVSRIIGESTVLMPINRQAINLGNAYALDEMAAFIYRPVRRDEGYSGNGLKGCTEGTEVGLPISYIGYRLRRCQQPALVL